MQEPGNVQLLAIRQRIGTVCLWIGGFIAVLVFIDRSETGVLSMPAFWYRSRSLHLMICVGVLGAGGLLLWKPAGASQTNEAETFTKRFVAVATDTQLFESVRLYTRANCSLCDEAMDVLEAYGGLLPEIEFVDIDGHVELERLHGESIPVLEIDGRIRFRGRIHRWLFERHLDARLRQREHHSMENPG